MKKIITMAVLIFSSMLTYACTGGAEQKQAETQKTAQEGSVIVMNKAMFIKDIFDYEKSKEWKYKGCLLYTSSTSTTTCNVASHWTSAMYSSFWKN